MQIASLRSFVSKAQVLFGLVSVFAMMMVVTVHPAFASSTINNQIAYQAHLMDPSGFPVADGAYSIIVSLYDSGVGGARLWTANGTTGAPTAMSVSVTNGLFTILLGDSGQNSLDSIDWNTDSLYLGVTVGADAEMTPRRRMAAAPQAFNSRQLQGMYASSTAFGTSNVFAINQTSNTAATGTRTALEVRSGGTSDSNDFLVRGINDLGSAVFTINRQGSVTSSGNLAVSGTVTASQMYVAGSLVCLASGTNCPGMAASTATLQQISANGATTTNRLNLLGGFIGASSTVTSTFTVLGTSVMQALTATNATVTTLGATAVSTTQLFVASQLVCLQSGTNCPVSADTLATVSARGSFATSTLQLYGGFIGASSTVTSTFTVLGGSTLGTLTFTNGTATSVTTTNLYGANASFSSVTSTAWLGFASASGTTLNASAVLVNGINACLEDGTNCAAVVSTDLNWSYELATNSMSNATPTTDIIFGSAVTSTGAPAYFDLSGGTSGESNFYFGYSTSSNVIIGGTSTTVSGFMNGLFALDGNDLFVGGNIGSATSIYTNGAFVAGSGSTYYGNGYISKNDAGMLQLSAVSGTNITNSLTQAWSSGTNASKISGLSIGNAASLQIIRGSYAYVLDGKFLDIIDISNPEAMTQVGTYSLGLGVTDLVDSGNMIYAVKSASISFIDITNPTQPVLKSTVSNTYGIKGMRVVNGYMYATVCPTFCPSGNGLSVFGMTTTTLTELGSVGMVAGNRGFQVRGNIVYAIEPNGSFLNVISISDPYTPTVIGSLDLSAATPDLIDIALNGRYAYLSDSNNGSLITVDIYDPSLPTVVQTLYGFDAPTNISLSGRYAYVSDESAPTMFVRVVDVQTTSSQAIVGNIQTGSDTLATFLPVGKVGFAVQPDSVDPTYTAYDLQGTELANLTAHSVAAGELRVGGKSTFSDAVNVESSLAVGNNLTVAGQLVCLSDGTNCQVSSSASASSITLTVASAVTLSNPSDAVVSGRYLYIIDSNYRELQIFDVINPTSPVYKGFVDVTYAGNPRSIVVDGNYAYVVNGDASSTLSIFNVSDPTNPTFVATKVVGTGPDDVAVSNGYAYVVNGTTKNVSVIDVSTPGSPVTVATTTVGNYPTAIAISGHYAYVTDFTDNTLTILDISVPSSPTVVTTTATGGQPQNLAVTNGFAYVANSQFGDNSMTIIDVNDPTTPVFVTTTYAGIGAQGITVSGHYAYVTNPHTGGHVVSLIDIADPFHPRYFGTGEVGSAPGNIEISGHYAYVVNTGFVGTVTIVDIDGEGATNLYSARGSIGSLAISDMLTVAGQSVCLANGANCPISGGGTDLNWAFDMSGGFVRNATATTDIVLGSSATSTGAPAYFDLSGGTSGTSTFYFGHATNSNVIIGGTSSSVSFMNSAYSLNGNDLFVGGNIGSASSVYTNGEFVTGPGSTHFGDGYITKTNGDLSLAASGSFLVASTSSFSGNVGVGTLSPITQLDVAGHILAAPAGQISAGQTPYGLYVQGRYAYSVGSSNLLNIFDLSNPTSITTIGSVATGSLPRGISVQGRYAYVVNQTSNTLQVIDISNPVAPVSVGTVGTDTAPASLYVQGRYAYVLNITSNTMQVIDVSAPTTPVVVGTVSTGVAPYGVYAQGRYAYVLSITGQTMQVIDISNPASPTVAGSIAFGAVPRSVYVQGKYAYVVGASDLLKIYDISDPSTPTIAGSVATGSNPQYVYVQGRRAYVTNAGSSTMTVYDVSDPTNPTYIELVGTGASPSVVNVQGRYGYVISTISGFIEAFDLGGAYLQQLEAGGIETGTLSVRNNLQALDATFLGGVTIGQSANVSGNVSVRGSISVGGSNVCLANGTNCPGVPASTSTLQQITANGATTTRQLYLMAGFIGASSTVTSTFTVLGATALQALTATNATFTTLGAITVSTTQLYVASQLVCLQTGTNCPGSSDTLATVSARGSFATSTLQLYGGFIGASSTVTSTFTVVGATTLGTLTFTNGTGTSVTSTNLFSTGATFTSATSSVWLGFATASGTTLRAGSILVNGSAVCLANGTNCPGIAASTSTLQQISNNGATTTNQLYLMGGLISASTTVTSTFTVLGNT
ncbi:MAG: hypothetical protein WCK01_01345, partial [Candidatus Uhrbacteria bacterium]